MEESRRSNIQMQTSNQASGSSPRLPPQDLRSPASNNSINNRTSSPQWDNRNRAFVSPTQISQLKPQGPTHEFNNTSNPTDNAQHNPIYPSGNSHDTDMNQGNQQHGTLAKPRPPLAGGDGSGSGQHSRRSSFFSKFKSGSVSSQQQIQQQQPQTNGTVSGPSYAQQGTRPGPNGPVNEFGGVRTSQYDAQSSPRATPLNSPSLNGNGHGAGAAAPGAPNQRQMQSQAQQQPPPPQPVPAQPPALHPEIRSVVQLSLAHARKVYFSGPLVRRLERAPDGGRPSKDEGWVNVWAQLGGTTLSIWDMAKIEEASKEGREVPPTYINTQDAVSPFSVSLSLITVLTCNGQFVQVLGSVTVPATEGSPPKRYTDVLTLNTAGSNLLLFSCPSTASLLSWAAALRLSAWEKSRLEEIYTAHLLRITIPNGVLHLFLRLWHTLTSLQSRKHHRLLTKGGWKVGYKFVLRAKQIGRNFTWSSQLRRPIPSQGIPA